MNPSSVAPVIVGVDGSASSHSAIRSAATFASLYDLPLQVIHAFNWLPRSPEPTDTHPGTTANELIQQAVTTARTVAPRLTISTRLLEGAPSSTLLRQARAASLLAIGDGELSSHVCLPTHTSAVHIAARASCSVLVATARQSYGRSIVVGVDGSAASERALDFAFDTAARSGTDLLVVRAETSSPSDGGVDDLADLIAARENKYHLDARIRVLADDPATALLAESRHADLLIIGARGRQRYRGLLGSVAQTLLHHSNAALILVRGLITPPPTHLDRGFAAASTA